MKQYLVHPSTVGIRVLTVAAIFGLASSLGLAADKKLVVGFAQVGAESGWRTANTVELISVFPMLNRKKKTKSRQSDRSSLKVST